MRGPSGGWALSSVEGPPADILADVPALTGRQLRWCEPDRDALVLGSAQALTDARHPDAAVRRRSGGSAVLVGPGRLLWADLVIPAADPLWLDDVSRAPLWVGQAWATALRAVGIGDAAVHGGPPLNRRAKACFAGLGPGEVTVGGQKVVGVCQRRTRAGALFQSALLLRWRPEETYAALAEAGPEPAAVPATGILDLAPGVDPAAVRDALHAALP